MNEKNNNLSLFTVSFKQGFVSPNVPIATFTQGNKKLNFLLDSGSENNVIDKNALANINHEILEGVSTTLTGVGGTSDTEICKLTFTCDKEEYTEEFLVADLSQAFGMIENCHSIILHGIIGSTFLKENNIVLDFKNFVAYNKK